jgi:hypothetical protein
MKVTVREIWMQIKIKIERKSDIKKYINSDI